jgi:hypothetical protein
MSRSAVHFTFGLALFATALPGAAADPLTVYVGTFTSEKD